MKSPLKDNPLRNPGETLDKQIDELIYDKGATYILIIVVSGVLALLEWWRWYIEQPPSPLIYSMIFAVSTAYSLPKLFKIKKQIHSLRQGRDGEKAVGQYLELLREQGAKVFHDIPGQNFNLDHVVITHSGIYVIETKTYSKPENGRAVIVFDGLSVKLNNLAKSNKPIIQVTAASSWLKTILKDSTGRQFEIKPVVVFPGWYVEPTSEAKNSDVWVLNPKALPTFISNSKRILNDEDINMATFHLSRYIRSYR